MKERLTGAIILVALIVLLVPELLTGPIRTKRVPAASARVAHIAPMSAAETLRTYTLTLGASSTAHEALATPAGAAAQPAENAQESSSESAPQSAPQSAAQSAAPGTAEHPPQTAPGLQRAKSPAHRAVREARSAGSSGGWVVQLGSFASHQNADRLARSLERKGFRMSVSPSRSGARVLWRVRAGPARDRAGAGHLAARLRGLGHRGELLPVR